jgi:hypothetical protein
MTGDVSTPMAAAARITFSLVVIVDLIIFHRPNCRYIVFIVHRTSRRRVTKSCTRISDLCKIYSNLWCFSAQLPDSALDESGRIDCALCCSALAVFRSELPVLHLIVKTLERRLSCLLSTVDGHPGLALLILTATMQIDAGQVSSLIRGWRTFLINAL